MKAENPKLLRRQGEGEREKMHREKSGGHILTDNSDFPWERKCNEMGDGGKERLLDNQPVVTY